MANLMKSLDLVVDGEPAPPLEWLTTRSSRGAALSYSCQFLGKRVLDFTLAGAACIVLMPLMVLIAVLIRLDSRGPALC
jgi:lipopolysaccharide/colanic/teichoic acid biosynthesis glycosyltransferase